MLTRKYSRRNSFYLCAAVMSALLGQQIALPQQATTVRSLVGRYVAALQQRDYKTLVELNRVMRMSESLIRLENPKFLWPKLIREHREKMVRVINGEEKLGAGNDFSAEFTRKDIGDQISYVPSECKWAIAEIRAGSDLSGNRFSTVFVTVTYATRAASPQNEEGKALKRTVLEFTVFTPNDGTLDFTNHVAAGDVLWNTPK